MGLSSEENTILEATKNELHYEFEIQSQIFIYF